VVQHLALLALAHRALGDDDQAAERLAAAISLAEPMGWCARSWLTEQGILDHDPRAAVCVQCGECEEKCPQRIPISAWMPVIHEVLGEGKPYVKSP
jgi:predicted aldo/keto reductase-like oxidoreductase